MGGGGIPIISDLTTVVFGKPSTPEITIDTSSTVDTSSNRAAETASETARRQRVIASSEAGRQSTILSSSSDSSSKTLLGQ